MSARQTTKLQPPYSPWTHRVAWGLSCATFLLVLSGSAVTTYEAGMAIDDWPTTRGSWFYPISDWLSQGRDLFLGHGHRLLGCLVGLLAIVLTVLVCIRDRRRGMRPLAVIALAMLLLEGVLGGLRVVGDGVVAWLDEAKAPGMILFRSIGDDLLLRRVHGWAAPLCFTLCTVLVTLTSRTWREYRVEKENQPGRFLRWLVIVLTASLFVMVVLGTQLRHLPLEDAAGYEVWNSLQRISSGWIWNWFQLWLVLKLLLAVLITAGLIWLFVAVLRNFRSQPIVFRRAVLCFILFLVQLALAAATWIANYGWPDWFTEHVWAIEYTIVHEGWWQGITTTLHAALGALNLIAALNLTIWLFRLRQPSQPAVR